MPTIAAAGVGARSDVTPRPALKVGRVSPVANAAKGVGKRDEIKLGSAVRVGRLPVITRASIGTSGSTDLVDKVYVSVPPVTPTTGQIWPRGG